MPVTKKQTWVGYMDAMCSKEFNPEDLKIEGVEKFMNINHQFHSIFHHSIPMIYLINYTTGKYLIVSKSVHMMMGYVPDDFISNGVGFTLDKYHKTDLKLFNEQIFPERLSVLKNIPVQEQPNYIFSYNYRLKNKQGEYTNLLQRNCFIKSDEEGNPLMSLGMVLNINHFKNENPVIQIVEKLSSNPENATETVYKKSFFLNDEDRLFTAREKEVLRWTADGLTSKEIAHKLNISENTIINHRRNMQEKSNTRNVTELVSFSIRHGII